MTVRRQAPLRLGELRDTIADALEAGPVGQVVKKVIEKGVEHLDSPDQIKSAVDKVLHEVTNSESALHTYLSRKNHKPADDRASPIPVPLAVCQTASKAAYKKDTHDVPSIGEGWTLLRATKNVKLWRKEGLYLLGVAGTDKLDPSDLYTDLNLPFNNGEATHRIQTDLQTLRGWKSEFPDGEWYGTGHSLGGAVLDVMLNKDLLRGAVTFNPAVEPQNFHRSTRNFRIYTRGDPIYNVMGQFVTGDDVQVRDADSPPSYLPGILDAIQHLRHQHDIKRFEGGRGGRGRKRVRGGGPPPIMAQDIEGAKLAYEPNREGPRSFPHLVPPERLKPSDARLSMHERALAVVADNNATIGGVQRLDGGRYDTKRVAFYITYDPFGGHRATKNPVTGEWRPRTTPTNKFPDAFNWEHMKHAYPIGSKTPWSLNKRTILVAVRGTSQKDPADISLDVRHLLFGSSETNVLASDPVYRTYVRAPVVNAQLQFPKSENDYFAVGHSLGGALADELVREHLVIGSVDFNPLVNTSITRGTTDPAVIQRLYMSDDWVFALLAGHGLEPFKNTMNVYPYTAGKSMLDAHNMNNFEELVTPRTQVKFPKGSRELLDQSIESGKAVENNRKSEWDEMYDHGFLGFKLNAKGDE